MSDGDPPGQSDSRSDGDSATNAIADGALDRDDLHDLAPLLRRVASLDAGAIARIRRRGRHLSVLARVPFGVLVARTLDQPGPDLDVTVRCAEALAWLDGDRDDPPERRDADWRGGTPPASGWRRIDTVPDAQVRPLVRQGALTLKQAAAREGVPGAQPRAEVADILLDSVVLTVSDGQASAPVTLRTLSAVTRLGFLPRESYVAVDVCGRWIRVAAPYGSVLCERPGLGLSLR